MRFFTSEGSETSRTQIQPDSSADSLTTSGVFSRVSLTAMLDEGEALPFGGC